MCAEHLQPAWGGGHDSLCVRVPPDASGIGIEYDVKMKVENISAFIYGCQ